MKKFIVFTFAVLLMAAKSGFAMEHPVQLAIFDPIQLVEESEDIKGLRLDLIYGVNENVTGLDLGFGVSKTDADFTGFNYHGIGNIVKGDATGIQWSYFFNLTEGDFTGWQGGFVPMTYGNFKGLQEGIVSYTELNFTGLQVGAVTITKGDLHGVQFGLVNYTGGQMKGLQLGFVNRSHIQEGLQIGLINVNDNKDPLYVFPFVNWKF